MSIELLFFFFFFLTVERSRVYGSGFVCRVSALRIKWAFSEDLKEEEKNPLEHQFLVCFFFLLVLFCLLFLLSGLIMLRRPSKD